MHIRDPIHGSIDISTEERLIIDSRFYQRLRQIKQLGFADYAFPGATHSRYSHGIGAMQVATRLFDALYKPIAIHPTDRHWLRQTLRLAVLLHDLGHPPLSHTSELILPLRAELKLPAWMGPDHGERATHEDMTLLLLLRSELGQMLRDSFSHLGIEPEHVASLICGKVPDDPDLFRVDGIDHGPLLRQLVSSELDADRMDYLLRDSFFTGVHYGKYDLDWLIQNLMAVERDKALYLGMDRRAVLAFEDFLLSRYHMFLSVYYHATSINFEKLLANYFSTSGDEYTLPADPEAYAFADDIQLISTLRRSQNPWAKRIVARKGFTLLLELNPFERGVDLEPVRQALKNEGIEHFEAESHGVLSKYFKEGHGQAPILVRTAMGTWARIEEYTPLFDRYAETARIARIYVAPEQRERARLLAGPLARL